MLQVAPNDGADAGARLAIRLLQDAAERGDLDPWDVDVIAVIDGFLDQLRQRIEIPGQVAAALAGRGGSYLPGNFDALPELIQKAVNDGNHIHIPGIEIAPLRCVLQQSNR